MFPRQHDNIPVMYKLQFLTPCLCISVELNRRMAPRGVSVGNLTTDWNDGTALCALVDYNVNGIYDLYQGKSRDWLSVNQRPTPMPASSPLPQKPSPPNNDGH